MAKYHVYIERKVSSTVEIEAPHPGAALDVVGNYTPSAAEPEGCDWAGEWEAVMIEDEGGNEIWTLQDQQVHAARTAAMTNAEAAQREQIIETARELNRIMRQLRQLASTTYATLESKLERLQLPALEALSDLPGEEGSFRPEDHHENCLAFCCRDQFGNRRPSRVS